MKGALKIIGVLLTLILISTVIVYVITNYSDQDNEENDQQNAILLRKKVVQDLQEFKMIKRIKNNRGLIKNKDDFKQISQYQKYVTPDNIIVKQYQTANQLTTPQKAYTAAIQWIWVSDQTLNGVPEKWLYPQEFLQDTPTDPDNPVPGNIVSDCESQAYSLVSILEALGTPKTDVRVVVGKVNFSGTLGGHAWVQIYENNQWFEVEATSGPYWDDDDNKLVSSQGFSYNYFKTHPYPVEEYWAFFNDRYYYNPNNGQKSLDLPNYWQ